MKISLKKISLRAIGFIFGRFLVIFLACAIINALMMMAFSGLNLSIVFYIAFGSVVAEIESVFFWFVSLLIHPYQRGN